MRASMIGVRPESIISTLARLTSTPMTLWPMEAKQAADTEPTYPNPKTLTDKPNVILLVIVYSTGYGRTIAVRGGELKSDPTICEGRN